MIAFQHQSDVRRVIVDEFDMPRAVEILREAKCEVNEIDKAVWNYTSLICRAEELLLYGQAEPEEG